MQYNDNQKIQDFIYEYLELCKKYDLCIGTTLECYDTEILKLYTLSDYDYYDFRFDQKGDPIPIYYTFFCDAISKNYDEKYFKKMLSTNEGNV